VEGVQTEAELQAAVERIGLLDEDAMVAARTRQVQLTKPPGALGRIEDLSVWLAGIRGTPIAPTRRKVIVTAAADHGVARHGVSAYPSEVTAQMVLNFLRGGAAVNVLARQAGADVVVVDAGVAADLPAAPGLVPLRIRPGTDDLSTGPAMGREDAVRCLLEGVRLAEREVARDADVIAVGDMGIGNTTASAAITAVFTGLPPAAVTGRGTGVDDSRYAEKVRRIELGLEVNRPRPADGVDVLTKVGGLEIGVLAGVCLGAAAARRPVVLDGFIATAGALVAQALSPVSVAFMVSAHRSAEAGHGAALAHLGLTPLLDLGMRLGEGTGAALGIMLLEAASRIMSEMATFAEAGVSGADAVEQNEG
jgi:nicotinate-nucleotide--dimethylbenzimidazole phosphoribosyltransferase